MKRLSLICLLSFVSLWAFDFNVDSWGSYLNFDPDKREALLSYPVSWLRPGSFLFEHDYQDSSSTYGNWEQILTSDETINYYPGMSNHIIAKYTPYSFPHRWSAGLEFTNYKGGNSTYRTDAVLHYQHIKGNVEYFHTSNTQLINFGSSKTKHMIRTHGLNFDYVLGDKLKLLGGVNINLIEQLDAIESRNYNIHHEQIALNYSIFKFLSAYGKFHYWYYHNIDRQGPAWLFYPGLRFNSGVLKSHFSLRISKSTVHPIFELAIQPGPFYLHAYTKTRSSRLDLVQAANQYYGVRSGLTLNSDHHLLDANVSYNYDVVRSGPADSIVNNDFSGFRASGEYRFKTRSIDLYAKAYYQNSINPRAGYYHPVRSVLTAGLDFRSGGIKNSLKLYGGLNAQYILHDDPDLVSFDPSKLVYTLNAPSDLISDWKINFDLKAEIQTFAISLNVSAPLKLTGDINYFLYQGIYTSSDFYIGNAFYAGLTIEWLWWK